jgi:replicative DNA helicase
MLLSKDAVTAAVEICRADDFYKPAHGHIFNAVISLYGQGEPADPVTVADELRRASLIEAIGGPTTLVSLQANAGPISNAGRYARIVEEHSLLRRLIGVGGEVAELGYSVPDDVESAVDRAEAMVYEVAQRRIADTMAPLHDLLRQSLDRLEMLYERDESITGTPTGFLDLDELLSGLQPSSMVIVGARPGAGKTSLALGMASHAAVEAGKPVLFFSLEMSHSELTQRILCSEAKVDSTRLRNGRLHDADWHKISHAIGRLSEAPLYIDDNPNLTVMEIRAKARRLKAKLGDAGLGMIVVDYIQLMTGRRNAENRQVEVSEISRGLKILARELEVPVVALSQLSRNLEARADKRPILADLRESGCMPANTRLVRADTGAEVTLGELVLSQEQPLVWSLDDEWRLVPRRLVRAFPSGVKPVFRLRLASGRVVDATANHPFRTIRGWTRLDELTAGDFVAVPRALPRPTTGTAPWEDTELVLLAHLLGDGSIGPDRVEYATADPANKTAVVEAARHLFDIAVRGGQKGSTWRLWLPSPYRVTHSVRHPIRNWLEPMGLWGSRSHDTFIPEELMGLDDRQIALFLCHLWATDGSITIGRNGRGRRVRVHYATSSQRLAEGVARLLLRLDIRSRITRARKNGYRDNWHVAVTGTPELTRLLRVVGCHGQRGTRIPEALEILDAIEPNPKDAVAASEVSWDEILEVVALGEMPTFDATVDDTHNFIANGVIAHNSLEQDADVVMFLYRDELYHPDTADKGVAELIVSKHRNGPTGITNLAWIDRYTRFANMARV